MERRRLGRTGHESTVAILGGAAFARVSPAQADAGFRLALERGVNHLDVAPSYGDAEVLLGPLVAPVRDRLFVAAKTLRRNPEGVRAQLEETLRRLGTDHLDLYQLHAVTSPAELDGRASAVEAILQARDDGLVRFVGVTGHDLGAPAAHLDALRRWDLDTVMFPVYPTVWADQGYRDDAQELLETCSERDVGVMAIKAAARRPWGGRDRIAHTWYEPWTDPEHVALGVRFALSTPGVDGFCTPGDLRVLALALDAADAYEPLDDDERRDAVVRAAGAEVIFPMAEKA